MADGQRLINELTFQLQSKEVVELHYPIQLSVKDANAILELLKEQHGVPYVFDADGETACGACGCHLDKAYGNCPKCGKRLDWNAGQE